MKYKNKKIETIINETEEDINKFIRLVESLAQSINSFITPKFQLERKAEIISEHDDYLNDGNTKTPGFKYDIYWSYPLSTYVENDWSLFRNGIDKFNLSFHLELQEREIDGRVDDTIFFSIHIADHKKNKRITYTPNHNTQNSILKSDETILDTTIEMDRVLKIGRIRFSIPTLKV